MIRLLMMLIGVVWIITIARFDFDYNRHIVFFISVLIAGIFVLIHRMMVRQEEAKTQLRQSEGRYKELVENVNSIIVRWNCAGKILFINEFGQQFYGYREDEIVGNPILGTIIPGIESNRCKLRLMLEKMLKYPDQHMTNANENLKKNGQRVWVQWNNRLLEDEKGAIIGGLSIGVDISERKMAEKLQRALYKISETASSSSNLQELYLSVHTIIGELIPAKNFYIALHDEKGEMIHFPYRVDECDGNPGSRPAKKGITEYVIRTGKPLFANTQLYAELEKSGEVVQSGTIAKDWLGVPLKTADNKVFGVMAVQTYTGGLSYTEEHCEILTFVSNQVAMAIERKQGEEKLKFLSLHDVLTGLYNRAYFEEALNGFKYDHNASISLIIGDIDGLKLINDSLGHAAGDQLLKVAAEIIREALRDGDVAARIGGDEFAIILTNADDGVAEIVCERIRTKIDQHNQGSGRIPISISLGYAAKNDEMFSVQSLFKEADDYMYREKLHHSQSVRSDIVQTVMKMLEVRDFITEGHADRLQDLASNLARMFGLPEKRIADIRLLAKFHDIGKVGIADYILFKPGRLTAGEKKEMQRHSEIGYRIAKSSADLLPIADWILKHHEWWNGQGYPLALEREDIPLECRILAIVDAYDAMTSDRPYRKAMNKQDALAELKRCSVTQFDPKLVEKFNYTI